LYDEKRDLAFHQNIYEDDDLLFGRREKEGPETKILRLAVPDEV